MKRFLIGAAIGTAICGAIMGAFAMLGAKKEETAETEEPEMDISNVLKFQKERDKCESCGNTCKSEEFPQTECEDYLKKESEEQTTGFTAEEVAEMENVASQVEESEAEKEPEAPADLIKKNGKKPAKKSEATVGEETK